MITGDEYIGAGGVKRFSWAMEFVLQLFHGLYTEIQDYLWGDWGAGVLQRTGKGGANRACGIGII